MILKIFTTKEYDSFPIVSDGNKVYNWGEIKSIVAAEIPRIKDSKNNVVILSGDNFSFIIEFFASIFSGKNIFLLSDKTRLNDLDFDYEVLKCNLREQCKNFKFPHIDIDNTLINFYTSGSSGVPKLIKKSLRNLINEANDIGDEFEFKNKNYTLYSTTTMCHLFGLTFHLMVPIQNGLVIGTQQISYPENMDFKGAMLVSTPTFLSTVLRHNLNFKTAPDYIISAGSKLDEKVFEFLEKKSKIIEIYGSTETGVIAHKTHYNDNLILFKNVYVDNRDDYAVIKSEYCYEGCVAINDKVEICNRSLKIISRSDRLFKINEKRVSADELENKLKNSKYVNNCYITKDEEKLVCLTALSNCGKEYLLINGVGALTKALKKYLLDFSEIIPQRWKYIDEIPMSVEGKINKKFVNNIFGINVSLPVILDRTIGEDFVIYKIFFHKRCNFFKGHFPEFKLVPGVFQIYFAKELANIHFGCNIGAGQWKKIKFSNIIEPDSIVCLMLKKNEKQILYEYCSDSKKFASGVLSCENIFEKVIR